MEKEDDEEEEEGTKEEETKEEEEEVEETQEEVYSHSVMYKPLKLTRSLHYKRRSQGYQLQKPSPLSFTCRS